MFGQFIIASLIGFIVGILTHAKRNKHIKMPRIKKKSLNPGFLLDSCFGAIASLVGVLVSAPTEMEKIILISILAGYAGEGLIDRLAEKSFSANVTRDKQIKSEMKKEIKSNKH